MSIIVQHRRDSRTNCEANTPAAGELWWDTTLNAGRMGDGATLGGYLLGRWGYKYPLAPSQITADRNDWAPTDFALAETMFVTSDAARTITGIAGGYAGARRTIVNRGAFDITLSNANVASSAANRFLFESDIVIRANGAVELQYSATDSRWMRANGGTKVSTIPQDFVLSGYLTPAQITSNQNDYAPAGVTTATVLRLNTDASRNITGLADPREGAVKTLINVGTNPIVLKNADAGSSAANRFDIGADVTLSQKQAVTLRYDGTDSRWKLLASTAGAAVADGAVTAVKLATSAIGVGPIINGYLDWSVAGNILTVALKTLAGTDPTASDPVLVRTRSVTANDGKPVWTTVAAALSAALSSGSSAGSTNNVPFSLSALFFNDGGTPRLGLVNTVSGISVMGFGAYGIASSTAEGGAGAADSAQTIYTGTAVTSKAYAYLGRASWESGLAAAGTWSAGPTRITAYGPGVKLPGEAYAPSANATGAMATGTTLTPWDNTIPQNTEGDQFMSQAHTPQSAANLLRVEAVANVAHSVSLAVITAALHQDSVANALAAVAARMPAANSVGALPLLRHTMVAATTSATTFKIRIGSGNAGTLTFNGEAGAGLLNGVLASNLSVTEIQV